MSKNTSLKSQRYRIENLKSLANSNFHLHRIKRGDRFFYTHSNGNGLGPVAKEQILKRTFSDVLCDVTQIPRVQKWVTLQPNPNYNNFKTCGSQVWSSIQFYSVNCP